MCISVCATINLYTCTQDAFSCTHMSVYVVFVKMSVKAYCCLSSPSECLPLDVHTCIFICEYTYVWKQVKDVLTVSGDVIICSFSPPGTHSPSMALGNTPSTMIKVPLSLKIPISSGPRDRHLAQAPGSPLRIGILNRKIIKAEIHPTGCALKNSLPLLQPASPRCRPRGILSGPQK